MELTKPDLDKLFADNQKLVYWLLCRYFPAIAQDEDIIQYAMIGLWKACLSYDAEKSKFATYASSCVLNEVRMELRRRKKYERFGTVISLDEPLSNDEDNTATIQEVIPDPDDPYVSVEYDMRIIQKILTPTEYTCLRMTMDGCSQRQICTKLHYSQSYVSRIVKKARSKIDKALECNMFKSAK